MKTTKKDIMEAIKKGNPNPPDPCLLNLTKLPPFLETNADLADEHVLSSQDAANISSHVNGWTHSDGGEHTADISVTTATNVVPAGNLYYIRPNCTASGTNQMTNTRHPA